MAQRLPTVVSATTAATPAESPATAGARAGFLGAGLIYVERSAVEFVAIQCGDRFQALAIIAHFDEGKASRLTCIAIGYNIDTVNRAIRLKKGAKRVFARAEAEVSYKYVFQLIFFPEFAERIGEQARNGVCRTIRGT